MSFLNYFRISSSNPGEDLVVAGDGRDSVFAIDFVRDEIHCNEGADTVIFDEGLDEVDNDCDNQNAEVTLTAAKTTQSR
jgi:hypothetical protein